MRERTLAALTAQRESGRQDSQSRLRARDPTTKCSPGGVPGDGHRLVGRDGGRDSTPDSRAGLEHRVDVYHLGIHELDRLQPAVFDAACSNFGPLNCVPSLVESARLIADRIRAGGVLVASVIGRVCPWEIALHRWRGNWKRLRVRFLADAVPVPLNGRTVWTRYYTPAEFERAFASAGFDARVAARARLVRAASVHAGVCRSPSRARRPPAVARRSSRQPSRRPPLGRPLPDGDEEDVTAAWLPRFACPECRTPRAPARERRRVRRLRTRATREMNTASFDSSRRSRARRRPDRFFSSTASSASATAIGRRSPDYYRMLPCVVARRSTPAEWRVRRDSFAHLQRHVLPANGHGPMRVLDLGAGSGWLSHRLAAVGHRVVAVDRLDDEADGLGACRHYPVPFAAVQADFDALPFEPSQFDLVVFDGSLHYAPDPAATLAESHADARPPAARSP